MAHLVSVIRPGTSLLALDPALLGDTLLVKHVTGLLHELADGGVVLAILAVGIVGGGVAVSGGSTVGTVCAVGGRGAADAGAGGVATGSVVAGGA